jgi:hypothetical protein
VRDPSPACTSHQRATPSNKMASEKSHARRMRN